MKEKKIRMITIITAVQNDPYVIQTFYFLQGSGKEIEFLTLVCQEWEREGEKLDTIYIQRDVPENSVFFSGGLKK